MSDPLYSVGTWCTERQAYTPQRGLGVPCMNVGLAGMREVLRRLKRMGYSCHRVRDSNGEHEHNDWAVLVERTDGDPISAIREGWKR